MVKRQTISRRKGKQRRAAAPPVRKSVEQREAARSIYKTTRPTFVAVSEWGCGCDRIAALAIRRAQIKVPFKAKPSQLLVYALDDGVEIAPTGWKHDAPQWPNGVRPRLVGLTTTHTGFKQKPTI